MDERERISAAAVAAGRGPDAVRCVYNVPVHDEVVITGPAEAVVEQLQGFRHLGFTGCNQISIPVRDWSGCLLVGVVIVSGCKQRQQDPVQFLPVGGIECWYRTCEPIELRHDKGVAFPYGGEGLVEAGTLPGWSRSVRGRGRPDPR
ncbi:MAG: hypothetical protein ACRDRN_02700 [Sciscionella sp.]